MHDDILSEYIFVYSQNTKQWVWTKSERHRKTLGPKVFVLLLPRSNSFKISYFSSIFHQLVYHDKCYLTILSANKACAFSLIRSYRLHYIFGEMMSKISHGFRTFFFHLASISRHDSSQRGNTIMICLQKNLHPT